MKVKLGKITYEIACLHHGVTGSSLILTAHLPNGRNKSILIDCGIYQEYEYENLNNEFPRQFYPKNINYVLFTHPHVDHSGRLPFLVKKGFANEIYCTNEAKQLMKPSLLDCAKILESESKILSKKKKKNIDPLYTLDDVKRTLSKVRGMNYNETYMLDENLSVTLLGNGHMMGAAMILLQIMYHGCKTINLLFTGDYNVNNLFQEVPGIPKWVKKLELIIIYKSQYPNYQKRENNFYQFREYYFDC